MLTYLFWQRLHVVFHTENLQIVTSLYFIPLLLGMDELLSTLKQGARTKQVQDWASKLEDLRLRDLRSKRNAEHWCKEVEHLRDLTRTQAKKIDSMEEDLVGNTLRAPLFIFSNETLPRTNSSCHNFLGSTRISNGAAPTGLGNKRCGA